MCRIESWGEGGVSSCKGTTHENREVSGRWIDLAQVCIQRRVWVLALLYPGVDDIFRLFRTIILRVRRTRRIVAERRC